MIQIHTNVASVSTSVSARCETFPQRQVDKPHLYLSEEKSHVQSMTTMQQLSARQSKISNTKIPNKYFKNVEKFKCNSNQSQRYSRRS
jgi:hypothetical protein